MKKSDQLIDIGPGAGELGGEIVSNGTDQIMETDTLTAKYLRREEIPCPHIDGC